MDLKYRLSIMQLTQHFGETNGPGNRLRDKTPAKGPAHTLAIQAYMAQRYRPIGCRLALG
jgi:hypothetical protein